ncbi:hypothetical protein [Porticoccus sp.]
MKMTEIGFYKGGHQPKTINGGQAGNGFSGLRFLPYVAASGDMTGMINNSANRPFRGAHQPMDIAGILSDFAQAGM